MKAPMQDLKEWIQSNVQHAEEQMNEWSTQKDYYEGMLFAYGQMLNSIDRIYLNVEKKAIVDAFLDGYTHSPDEGFPEYAKNYYNEKFK